ncbi:MAG: hypothetical protein M1818_004817 [Claussenomyces sp. TS43310]|nr:MAG: hypothetical protein M1818_004817 [Claussenomyces sp. TS43310]
MARPFYQDASPLTAHSGTSNTPISYQANVNRQKTKKWTEARKVDYGGDDWGDDYDEYADDYAPEPSLPKPTGLRQPGQALYPEAQGLASSDGRKGYGDLSSGPVVGQDRSATNPGRARASSFDRDDERRAFSSTHAYSQSSVANVRTPSPSATPQSTIPPTLHVQTNSSVTGLRKPVPAQIPAGPPVPEAFAQPPSGNDPMSSSSKYSHSTGYGTDFSPSAVPSPLHTRILGTPQSAAESSITKFPPQQSSTSRQQPQEPAHQRNLPPDREEPETEPSAEGRSELPGTNIGSPMSPAAKALPFIRPADIYKRHIEEQREKERQSSESGRPSLDSIAKLSDRSASPATQSQIPQPSSDGYGGSTRRGEKSDYDVPGDNGRRAPTLQPVMERNSEYRSDDLNPTSFPTTNKSVEESHRSAPVSDNRYDFVEPEEPRRYSVSPKLPDLNRLSAFGMDLFGPPTKPAPSTQTQLREAKSVPRSDLDSSTTTLDAGVRSQPSLGFTSVVQQAFDVPPDSAQTAASPNSQVRRSDSESTGTTGISPIMSRAPSAGTVESRNRELEARELATPAIAEAEEPDSRRGSASAFEGTHRRSTPDQPAGHNTERPVFQPGHRRDLSTPSPGNSPARVPNVASGVPHSESQAAQVSRAAELVTPPEVKRHELNNPPAEYDQNFRPELPGGWVSYATTDSSATPGQDDGNSERSDANDTPVGSASKGFPPINDVDLSPTFGRPQKSSPSQTVKGEHLQSTNSPRAPPSNNDLPTPDPALAPIGNPYAITPIDARLKPEGQLIQETMQPRRPAIEKTLSSASTIPPTPPLKDTPYVVPVSVQGGYFQPVTAAQQNEAPEGNAAGDEAGIAMRPHMLPTLSTQTSLQDEESDRLHKEIIRSLSPRVAEPGDSPGPSARITDHTEVNDSAPGTRESTYLASVYDDYWTPNDEVEDTKESMPDSTREPVSAFSAMDRPPSQPFATPIAEVTAVAPAQPRTTDTDYTPPRPPIGGHRFSWDAGSENVSHSRAAVATDDEISTTRLSQMQQSVPDEAAATMSPQPEDRSTSFQHSDYNHSHPNPDLRESQPSQATYLPTTTWQVPTVENQAQAPAQRESLTNDRWSNATVVAPAPAVPAAPVAKDAEEPHSPQRRSSIAEEKDPGSTSVYAVPVTPPEEAHPAESTQPLPPSTETGTHNDTGNSFIAEPELSSQQPAQGQQPPVDISRMKQYKDIISMKSPDLRIKAFNDSRQQFAAMNSGLRDWLLSLTDEHPELMSSGDHPSVNANSSTRSRYAKPSALPSPIQQPYYQQYLNANANSPTSSTTPMRPATGPPGGQQGFSQGGSKLTSQQMQAKSKEILHSAGIFGGKASKAGKGLLAKGKSKLRGAGGGDKDSPDPRTSHSSLLAKSDIPRRSSWGLPLALTRTGGRASTSSQTSLSREQTPVRPAPAPRLDSALLPRSAATFRSDLLRISTLSGALSMPSSANQKAEDDNSDRVREGRNGNDSSKELGTLDVPAPIAKDQPSWDPFNATPIEEEEGSPLDEPTQKSGNKSADNFEPATLLPSTAPETERPGMGEVITESTEQPPEVDDWVLVPKQSPSPRTTNDYDEGALEKELGVPLYDIDSGPLHVRRDVQQGAGQNYQASSPTGIQQLPLSWDEKLETTSSDDEADRRSFIGLPPIRKCTPFGLGLDAPEGELKDQTDDFEDDQVSAIAVEDEKDSQPHDYPARTRMHELRPASRDISNFIKHNPGEGLTISTNVPLEGRSGSQAASSDHSQPASSPQSGISPSGHIAHTSCTGASQISAQEQYHSIPPEAHQRKPSNETREHLEATVARLMGQPVFVEAQRGRSSSQNEHPSARLVQQKLSDQPPSSAQRYPDLFRPESHGNQAFHTDDEAMSPARYSQASASREQTLLSRQQAYDRRLSGASISGPNVESDERRKSRTSSFFKELGGKISGSTSRNRSTSDFGDSARALESRGSQGRPYSESNAASEEGQERKKRRPSFLGLVRTPTIEDAGKTERPNSFLENPRAPVPIPHQASAPAPKEKKKLMFGGSQHFPHHSEPSNHLLRSASNVPSSSPAPQERKWSFLGNSRQPQQPSNAANQNSSTSGPSEMKLLRLFPQERQRDLAGGSRPPPQKPHSVQTPPSSSSNPLEQQQRRKKGRFSGLNSLFSGLASTEGGRKDSTATATPPKQPPASQRSVQTIAERNLQQMMPVKLRNPRPAAVGPSPQQTRLEQKQQSLPWVDVTTSPPMMTSALAGAQLNSNLNKPLPHVKEQPQYQMQSQSQPQYQQADSPPVLSQVSISQPWEPYLAAAPSISSIQADLSRESPPSISSLGSSQANPPGPAPTSDWVGGSGNTQAKPYQHVSSQPRKLGHPLLAPPKIGSEATVSDKPRTTQKLGFQTQPDTGVQGYQGGNPQLENQGYHPGIQHGGSLQGHHALRVAPPGPYRTGSLRAADLTGPSTPPRQQLGPFAKAFPKQQVGEQKAESKQNLLLGARKLGGLIGLQSSKQMENDVVRSKTGNPAPLHPGQNSSVNLQSTQANQGHTNVVDPRDPSVQQAWTGLGNPQERGPPVNDPPAPDPRQTQERGRPVFKEPHYAPTPIPGAYGLVRGEGSMLAPGSYDPRGFNYQASPPLDPWYGHQSPPMGVQQWQGPQYVPPQLSAHAHPPPPSMSSQDANPQPAVIRDLMGDPSQGSPFAPVIVAPTSHPITIQAPLKSSNQPPPSTLGQGPTFGASGHPTPQFATRRKMRKPLSTEDILARSPARQPIGQQAPYQLRLPREEEEDDDEEGVDHHRPLPTDQNRSNERPSPRPDAKSHIDKTLPTERAPQTERRLPAPIPLDTNVDPATSAYPMNPAAYPLPDASFSPINPQASDVPAPPLPQWSDVAYAAFTPSSQAIHRSNTVNTFASDLSPYSASQPLPPPPPSSPRLSRAAADVTTAGGSPRGQGSPVTESMTPSPPSQAGSFSPQYHHPLQRTSSLDGVGHAHSISPPDVTVSSTPSQRDQPSREGFSSAPPRSPVREDGVPTEPPTGPMHSSSSPPVLNPPEDQSHDDATMVQEDSMVRPEEMHRFATPATATDAPNVRNPATVAVSAPSLQQQPPPQQPEEKIWHSPPDGLEIADIAEMDGDPQPVMSATSYPGMEWNPYGGGFDEFVD